MTARGETPEVRWGVAARALPGERACGDAHVVVPCVAGTLAAVADGLGHGPGAERAALAATAAVEAAAGRALPMVLAGAQKALARTRGAALALAWIEPPGGLRWLSVGNVEGVVVRAATQLRHERLALSRGVVGGSVRAPREIRLSLASGDVLLVTTDGVRDGFLRELRPWADPQALAVQVLEDYARGTDDALVLAVRFRGGRP